MIALLEGKRAGLLGRGHWLPNLLAGVVVGVVALPLALAFAIASGVKPEQGLYTAIVAGMSVSLLGGSRFQIAGPTGAFVVILSGVTAKYGVQGLQIATLLAGLMLVLLGLARFGSVIRYIPDPVIVGFTTGIAVIIWVGQWHYFFGLPAPGAGHFHEKFYRLLLSLPHLHGPTTLLGLAGVLLLVVSPRILPRVPAPLVAVIALTLTQSWLNLPGVATIGSAFGGIPQALPRFVWPAIDLRQCLELLGPAFTIALLGAIESLLSAVVADGMTGTRHDSNQELVGQGVANLLCPLFGGFAATGAIARTATNVRNGATGPLAGVVHALTLILIVLACAPLAADVPLAALAAVLFVVSWNMSDLPHFKRLLERAPRNDVLVLLITFALTVLVDLIVAVNIGVILTLLLFMRRMAQSVEIRRETVSAAGREAMETEAVGLMVYAIDGPLFFGAAEAFQRTMEALDPAPARLAIRLGRVPFMDATALKALESVVLRLRARGTDVLLAEAKPRVKAKLERARLIGQLGHARVEADLADILAELDRERAEQTPAPRSI